MGDLLIFLHIFKQLFMFFLCSIAVLNHHSVIMLQLPVLNSGNITNGILKPKTNQHQSHASCNSKDCHDQTLLVTEKISDCGLPGKA